MIWNLACPARQHLSVSKWWWLLGQRWPKVNIIIYPSTNDDDCSVRQRSTLSRQQMMMIVGSKVGKGLLKQSFVRARWRNRCWYLFKSHLCHQLYITITNGWRRRFPTQSPSWPQWWSLWWAWSDHKRPQSGLPNPHKNTFGPNALMFSTLPACYYTVCLPEK